MSTDFARSVANGKELDVYEAGFVKKCRIGAPCYVGDFEEFLEEGDVVNVLMSALARMRVEELTMMGVVITKRVLKLVKVVAPRLKVLKIAESCCMSAAVSVSGGAEDHRTVIAMPPPTITIHPLSNLRRLYTDALFTIDACIARGAALTHLEIDGMHVSWQDTRFLYTRHQSFPSLTHIRIHDVINTRFGQMPMEISVRVGTDLPNLISFKAPPGLLPEFFGLGPKLEVLDSTGTNSEEPYADSSHPFLRPSGDDFTTTNIRELVVFDCNLNSPWVVPPMDKPVPHLKVMRVIYTCTADDSSNEYTVPKLFEELGTMCEARTARWPVEDLVITLDKCYFTRDVGRSSRDCSWAIDLKQQLEMIKGLADGLPRLTRVLFHAGFVAWVKDELQEDAGEWKPRMLNAMRFTVAKRIMSEVTPVDYLGCLEPFLS
ncbi:hypothetical protein BDZ89DRAFT_1071609 [Hymenopellis radicata]|nr:hypothetical protein BDZ89DRAFT_1071609 [Hymenopellis radicata]